MNCFQMPVMGIGKESAEMMERIVRQGRAFGVHITILSSQSYS
ncbi:MAG: hypothetical protein ACLT1J_03315 [Mediterraneibacter gnavus]